MDQQKLIKIMQLTTSSADGEALNAIRLANKMLASEKLNWEQYLGIKGAKATKGKPKAPAGFRKPIWRENLKGNWTKWVEGYGIVTVFQGTRDDMWKWVNDGVFGRGFRDPEDAMDDWDRSHR